MKKIISKSSPIFVFILAIGFLALACVFALPTNALASGKSVDKPEAQTESMTKNEVPRISVAELKDLISSNADIIILDIRTVDSYENSRLHIPGDMRVSFREIKEKLSPLDRGADIITYCT
jgi:hypothetical protein